MSVEIKIPKTGMGISEGTIAKWHKAEGEPVTEGEIIVEIETAKALEEVESPVSGTLQKILLAEEDDAEVGTVIAIIEGN